MNKLKKAIIFCILILLFSYVMPQSAKASENYYISSIVINADVKANGDMDVEEIHNYVFNGAFNGMKRDIKTNGSSGISNISTEVLSNGEEEDVAPEVTKNSDSTKIKIYSKSNNEKKAFVIRYTLKNVITKFSDVGELKWVFYKNEDDVKTDNITVYVSLPNKITNKVKYYGEGPERGTAKLNSDGKLQFELNNVDKDEVIGSEVDFPLSWVNTSKKINMKRQAYYENEDRKEKRNIAIVVVGILLVITLIYMRRKKRKKAIKEYRDGNVFFYDKYCFELPDNLSPALVSVLLDGEIEIKDLLATILDLANRGIITFLQDSFKNKDYDAVAFKINEGYDQMNIKPYEKFLIKWLKMYDKKGVIRLKYLKEEAKSREFRDEYYDFEDSVLEEAEKLGFYTVIVGKRILTNEYKNEEQKWRAYKRYLEDYKDIEVDKKQNIEDKVLPYAISLECSENIFEDINDSLGSSSIFMSYWFLSYYATDYSKDFSENYSSGINNSSSSGDFSGGSGDGFGGGGGGSAF
ncbi:MULTISPECIES: DUF2207 domain-containing protein [Clostridium]|uniref:DUF2207 domain-containing protein n=1 Tax=Clostridium TaxID=1485 RepID=UPI0008263BC4|nr:MULTISPECIES: DUF2207 domain-containing protein [Clostridium]PJI07538.1 DUF2207 domain-containing protein [Clostridium sp. CT7]